LLKLQRPKALTNLRWQLLIAQSSDTASVELTVRKVTSANWSDKAIALPSASFQKALKKFKKEEET